MTFAEKKLRRESKSSNCVRRRYAFSQQPSLASATQQALFSLQQARLAEQQSLGFSPAANAPVNSRPRTRNEPANSCVNMELSAVSFV